jgi:hypothetical protein
MPAPLLVINPPADALFVLACETAMDPPLQDPDELQRTLRRRYPRTVVRPRSLAGESIEVWYVYREGRWVSAP